MGMLIPNQRTREPTTIQLSSGKYVSLPPGSFVKYVGKGYLPRYPRPSFDDYDERFRVAVFTHLGLGLINRDVLDWNVL